MTAEHASADGGPKVVCDPQPDGSPILDLDHLRRFTFGSTAFERELLGLFSAELEKTSAALRAAGTAAEWHMAAHTLKGSALGIGATRLAKIARDAEMMPHLSAADRAGILERIGASVREVLGEAHQLGLL